MLNPTRKNRRGGALWLMLIPLTLIGCEAHQTTPGKQPSPGGRPPTDPWALSNVSVREGRLVDEMGRSWLLRGTNAKFETLFDVTFTDGRMRNGMMPAFADFDAPESARLGFNFVRLAISWSGLEPREGEFSQEFLELLDRVVDSYEQAGIYVLIDFHEDAYSKEIGEDGAPLWAIIPPPEKLLSGPLVAEGGLTCPCDDLDRRRTSAPVLRAFRSFFTNAEGIQDRFVPAWQLVAARYADRSALIGFEAMNEPVVAHVAFGVGLLDAFHLKMASALREIQSTKPYWLEPEVVTRNFGCAAPLRDTPFPDSNVVYTPHLYPALCLKLPPSRTFDEYFQNLTPTFDSMVEEGRSYGAAVVLGEWFTTLTSPADFAVMDAFHALADERNIGLAQWFWRSYSGTDNCDSTGSPYCYSNKEQRWKLVQPGLDHFVRPYPMAVPGRLAQNSFDRAQNVLTFAFEAQGGEGPPLLFIPAHRFPQGYSIEVDGRPVAAERDERTQRVLLPWSGEGGHHQVIVRGLPTSG